MNQQLHSLRQPVASFSGRTSAAILSSISRKSTICRAVLENEGTNTRPDGSSKNMSFLYMSSEQALAAEMKSMQAVQEGLAEYEELKALLLKRTWRFGTLFAVYLLLTINGECAFCELLGSAASYGYLTQLIKDTEAAADPETPNPIMAAEQEPQEMNRRIAKFFASYQTALKPRLLIPVGLLAGCAAWNTLVPEYSIGIVEEACMVGGFLSFKIALVLKVYDELKPKVLTAEELRREKRPNLVDVGEDIDISSVVKRPSERKKEEEEAAMAAADLQQENADNKDEADKAISSSDEAIMKIEGVSKKGFFQERER